MKKRKSPLILKILTAGLVSLAVFLIIAFNEGKGRSGDAETPEPADIPVTSETEKIPVETTATPTPIPTVTVVPETSETSETSETTETIDITITAVPTEPDIDYIRDAWVYSVWYDPVESNPADYDTISSDEAFALKGVFYFNTLLTADFETKLYKGDSVLLTGQVKMRDNVTAEADFSAGLEDIGTFEAGDYRIELLYKGETVAVTSIMRVK